MLECLFFLCVLHISKKNERLISYNFLDIHMDADRNLDKVQVQYL